MATRGRKESSHVASLLCLAGIFLVLWGPRPASADGSAFEQAKEQTDSWANWVQDKVTEGLGLRHENARMAAEQIKDNAGHAAGKISSAASDTAKYATQTADEIKDAVTKNRHDKKLNVNLKMSKGGRSTHVDDLMLNEILMTHASRAGGKSPITQEKLLAMLKAESPVPNEKLMEMLKETPLTEEKLMAILKAEGLNSNSNLKEAKSNAMLKTEAAQANIKDGANMVTNKVEKAYEGAKEKASQATGDVGAVMQKKAGEL